ncbi:hypothetical protein FRC12_016819 [Ceratobasidium sp. 428]|nr:hypothetical protein FRC12_016819 [Ceratobasidium sp. 428]
MSAYYDNELVHSLAVGDTGYTVLSEYVDLIEHDGTYGAHSLQAIAEDAYNESTPKMNQGVSQGHAQFEVAPHHHSKSHAGDVYDMHMSTPPLSPSTTVSSLQTDESSANYYSQSQESLSRRDSREEIKKGKQRETPSAEEPAVEDNAAQDDSDWYGMQYALDSSRMDRPDASVMWPPSAGETSTSDAAFVAMYDGYIYPQDVEYWYAHWCKWHRALAREEKRRRDRASSDPKHTRYYQRATYIHWEQDQRKKVRKLTILASLHGSCILL